MEESEHYDSDKENRDPALTPQVVPKPKKSPGSRKRRNSSNKFKETVVRLSERLVTAEVTLHYSTTFIFFPPKFGLYNNVW